MLYIIAYSLGISKAFTICNVALRLQMTIQFNVIAMNIVFFNQFVDITKFVKSAINKCT